MSLFSWVFPFNIFKRRKHRIDELEALSAALAESNKKLREEVIKCTIAQTNLANVYMTTITALQDEYLRTPVNRYDPSLHGEGAEIYKKFLENRPSDQV